MLKIAEAWGATYPGRKPGPNQDSILVQDTVLSQGQKQYDGGLPFALAVADGISGDPGGEIASYLALYGITGNRPRTLPDAVDILKIANALILKTASNNPPIRSMCTTIAAAWIYEDSILWCTRGDTPLFIATDRGLMQISQPHTDYAGYITSYLGAGSRVTLSTTDGGLITHGLESVRAVVIMSDGISKFVAEGSLDVLASDTDTPVRAMGLSLMQRAFRNGSYDNMSFVMARLETAEEF